MGAGTVPMRLTGGSHGGRRLTAAGADIRPTQDKVRAAIFSTLASVIPGARVLDLFAGSGALGLEANHSFKGHEARVAQAVCQWARERSPCG